MKHRPVRWLAITAGISVFAICAAVSIGVAPETYPVADTATTSISTLRAARGDLATGAYSRYFWHHPGPLLYQLLAPGYVLSGRREMSLKWSALALNLGWLALASAVVYRRSPTLAVAIAFALIPLVWRDQGLLFSPWNPLAPVLALPAAVAVAANLSYSVWSFPALVALLSFCVQSHAGLAIVSVVILLLAVTYWTQPLESPARSRSALWALAVAALLWAAPVTHDLTHRPGDLESMARFLLDSSAPRTSWSRAGDIGAYALNAPYLATWDLSADLVPSHVRSLVVWVTVLELTMVLAVAILARRGGAKFEATFALIALAASLSGPIAIHGIVGPIHAYLVRWLAAIGALSVTVLLWALCRISGAQRWIERWSVPLLFTALVMAAGIGSVRLWGKHLDQATDTTIRALSVDLRGYADFHGIRRPLLGFVGDTWQQGAGLVLQFYKDDVPISVSSHAVYVVGEPFAPNGHEDGEFFVMPVNGMIPPDIRATEWVTTRGGYRIVRVIR